MRVSQKTEIINAALKKAFNLERCGEYQKAYNLLKGFLDKSGCSLNLNKVPKKFHAELCLRFGAVYGHFGSVNAVLNSQSLSKDLLSRARSLFLNNGDEEKVSECETYLASAYVRQSEFGEADAWISKTKNPYKDRFRILIHYIDNTDFYMLISLSIEQFSSNFSVNECYINGECNRQLKQKIRFLPKKVSKKTTD